MSEKISLDSLKKLFPNNKFGNAKLQSVMSRLYGSTAHYHLSRYHLDVLEAWLHINNLRNPQEMLDNAL
jgi:hypothetical protein